MNYKKKIKEEGNYKEWVYETNNGVTFTCFIRRNFRLSHLCGYVQLTKDNKLFEQNYWDITDPLIVHGGVTYTDYLEDKWLIGFDCSHYSDMIFDEDFIPSNQNCKYRDMDYVIKECESLAEQLSQYSISVERNKKIKDCLD